MSSVQERGQFLNRDLSGNIPLKQHRLAPSFMMCQVLKEHK